MHFSSDTPTRPPRIVFTGGPGAGKTSALAAILKKRGDCALVSEIATLLYQHQIRRPREPREVRAVQRTIYRIQREWEDLQAELCPDRILLCDRGSLDGSAYWPKDGTTFFEAVNTTCEVEADRYDAVLFFETAAAGGFSITENNETRTETTSEAVAMDRSLRKVWECHPRFFHVPFRFSLDEKIALAESILVEVLASLTNAKSGTSPR